jgi:hypothetical protein
VITSPQPITVGESP